MVFTLSNVKVPYKSDSWLNKDLTPTEQFNAFLSQVSDNNAIINQGFFNYKQSFADLLAIDEAIPSPDDWLSIMTDQGLAVYNPALGWVLASDNATLIT